MSAAFAPGPYTLAGSEPVVIDGVTHAPSRLFRDNDGSLAIMAPEATPDYPGERRRIGGVNPIVHRPKRGTGWQMAPEDDPVQWATAQLLMAAPDFADAAALIEQGGAYIENDCVVISGAAYRLILAALAKATGKTVAS